MVARICVFALVVAAASLGSVAGAFHEAKCTSAYNYLAGCLTFVSGPDTIPGPICCDGVGHLNANDPHCLCTIIRELDQNPTVNYTKACTLPLHCIVAVDAVECPGLDLPPGYALPPSWPAVGYYTSQPGRDDESAASPRFRPSSRMVILLLAAFSTSLSRIL